MKAIRGTRKTPPRFVARTMIATFATVGFILAAVFVVVTVAVRATVRSTVAERLDTGQRILSALEQRRGRELQTRVATLAENPTLKAAMDTYHQELRLEHGVQSRELLDTIERQVNNLVTRIHPDIVVVTDPTGAIVAVQGKKRADWPPEGVRQLLSTDASGQFVALPGAVFRFAAAPLVLQDGQNTVLGELQLATALDSDYAAELSSLSGAGTVIVSHDAIVASTLPPSATRALTPAVLTTIGPSDDNLILEGQHYAVKLLFRHGGAAVFALDSIDASAEPLLATAFRATLFIALGALALGAIASLWLAHTVARPINTLSRS